MKDNLTINRKFLSFTIVISFVVALLIHFPEVLSLSDRFEQHSLFPNMNVEDVLIEVLFSFVSLVFLFTVNTLIFRFNDSYSRITIVKIILSFLLSWGANNLLGKWFVFMHNNFNIPAIDSMVHHYLHPMRDFIMAGIATGSCYIFHLIARQQRITLENQQLRTESITNQYEALKNQLNPHMLFNSLNTLQSLTRENAEKASDYIQELSHVLRYTLQANESQSVTLKDEMQFIEAYIFLLKMRYEENLNFDLTVDACYNDWILPPMSLQVLVENAVKHNEISNRNPLTIHIDTQEGQLMVSNIIHPKRSPSSGTKIGLDNLSKRYRLLFKQEITIAKEEGKFNITLPLINPSKT